MTGNKGQRGRCRETEGLRRGHFKSAVAGVKCGHVVTGLVDGSDPDFRAELLGLSTIDTGSRALFFGQRAERTVLCIVGYVASH